MPDKSALIEALRQEIGGWGAMMPEQVAVPGMFLVQVFNLLREQEPVKPIVVDINNGLFRQCGNCKSWLRVNDEYCGVCGRKVKWSATD